VQLAFHLQNRRSSRRVTVGVLDFALKPQALADLMDAEGAMDVAGPAVCLEAVGDSPHFPPSLRDACIKERGDFAH
jgi:hypothetical protein